MEQKKLMTVGEIFPQVLGVDARGQEVKRSDFPGKRLIVYFYPKDNTPGCTAEACSLRNGYAMLQKAGYQVIGVSKDSEASHQKFAAKYELPFPLISDPEHRLCEEAGVWQLKKGVWFMPTYHPAALLRDLDKKRPAWEDFKAIRDKLIELGVYERTV